MAVPVCAAALTAGYVGYRLWKSHTAERRINPMIQLDSPKVTDVFDIEELAKRIEPGKKISLCRCWKSQKVKWERMWVREYNLKGVNWSPRTKRHGVSCF